MDFIKALVETEHSKRLKSMPLFGSYEDLGFRMLAPVVLSNGVSLSIQASYAHYCSPRKTLPLEEYTSMEAAIFLNDEWSKIEEVSSNEILIDKFNAHTDGQVYAVLPVELIEDLYQELNSKN